MAAQLYNIDGVTIDLDMIVYVSDEGHICLNSPQAFHRLSHKDYVKMVVEVWGKWKAYKLRIMAGIKS